MGMMGGVVTLSPAPKVAISLLSYTCSNRLVREEIAIADLETQLWAFLPELSRPSTKPFSKQTRVSVSCCVVGKLVY